MVFSLTTVTDYKDLTVPAITKHISHGQAWGVCWLDSHMNMQNDYLVYSQCLQYNVSSKTWPMLSLKHNLYVKFEHANVHGNEITTSAQPNVMVQTEELQCTSKPPLQNVVNESA